MKTIAGFACFLLAAGMAASAFAAAYTGTVTKDMTIRKTKSTSGTKLGSVAAGDVVDIESLGEKWSEVTANGVTGYVLTKNLNDFSAAGSYDDAAAASYLGTAKKALTVRAKKDRSAQKMQSFSEGEQIYVLELGKTWLKVVKHGIEGYVLTEGVTGLQPAREGIELPDEYVSAPAFVANYTAQADLNLHIHKKKDAESGSLGTVQEKETVDVMNIDGDWAYVRKGKAEGYVLASHLKHFRRTDPFGPVIPGVTVYPYAAQMTDITELYDAESGELLRTIPAGAVVPAEEPAEDGNIYLPYYHGRARLGNPKNASLTKVSSWEEAQPGDLLSVFTTFFEATPATTLQAGRIFNITEGVKRINGTFVAPEAEFSFNALCAPYTKNNGYELGPIINYVSSQKSGYSGGICQVTTTLYNAVLQMPLTIVRQQVHSSYGVFYVPLDMDAAVGGGNLDFKFSNPLSYGVRIAAEASGGVLTVRIYREDAQ